MTRKLYMTILICVTVVCVIVGTISHAIGLAMRFGSWLGGQDAFAAEGSGMGATKHYDVDGSFDALELKLTMGNLVVQRGASFDMTWTGAENRTPVVQMKGDTLTVTQKNSWRVLQNPLGGKNVLSITLPANRELDTFSADLDMGDCRISGVTAKKAAIDLDAGNLELESGVFSTLDIDADMGNVTVRDCAFSGGEFDADMGNITVENAGSFKALALSADLGNIDFSTSLSVSELSLDLDTDLGTVTLNGEKLRGSTERGSGSARLEASANLGNIQIKTAK